MATPNATRTDATRAYLGTGQRQNGVGHSRSRPAGPPCPSRSPTGTTGPARALRRWLVIHALTGSADAAGDWWTPLIGPGLAFDTDAVGVLCANLLGGNYGSTGPPSTNPQTGLPWGDGFPAVTARDKARALWALADHPRRGPLGRSSPAARWAA